MQDFQRVFFFFVSLFFFRPYKQALSRSCAPSVARLTPRADPMRDIVRPLVYPAFLHVYKSTFSPLLRGYLTRALIFSTSFLQPYPLVLSSTVLTSLCVQTSRVIVGFFSVLNLHPLQQRSMHDARAAAQMLTCGIDCASEPFFFLISPLFFFSSPTFHGLIPYSPTDKRYLL